MEDIVFIGVRLDINNVNNNIFPAVSSASALAGDLDKNLSWGIYFVTPFDVASQLNVSASDGEVLIFQRLDNNEYAYYNMIAAGYAQDDLTNFALDAFVSLGNEPINGIGGGDNNNDGNGLGGNLVIKWGVGILLFLLLLGGGRKRKKNNVL